MRIIAGIAKGHKLHPPKGQGTRPTPCRVREALFSILGDQVINARVLDLYSGTGAMGIEALSRGAAHATFVEHDAAMVRILRKNLEIPKINHQKVLQQPVERALERLAKQNNRYDLIFMDPPFALDLLTPTLTVIAANDLLAPGGMVLAEHSGRSQPPLGPSPLRHLETRMWGDVAVSLLTNPGLHGMGGTS